MIDGMVSLDIQNDQVSLWRFTKLVIHSFTKLESLFENWKLLFTLQIDSDSLI